MADNPIMGQPRSKPPSEWDTYKDTEIHHAGDDIYYLFANDGDTPSDVWVYHWHRPTKGAHRWSVSTCSNHTLVQKDPLTLDPSLACQDGCPSHGWIRNGIWTSV